MLNEMRPFIDYNPFTSFYHFWKDFFTMNESPMYQIWYYLSNPSLWWRWVKTSMHLDFGFTAIVAIIAAIGFVKLMKHLPAFCGALVLRRTPVLGE